MTAQPMGRADLHIHTDQGDGVDSVEAIFEHVEAGDLNLISITEHDCLEVALAAREVWARGNYRFDFVPGVEVTTLEGHVIALYLEKPVASLRRVEETIEAVHKQGGVCFVPHPMSWLTRSIGRATFEKVTAAGLAFDAVELCSANPTTALYLNRARRLNDSCLALPAIGASDAHFRQAIGSAYTLFAGTSALDLRASFADGSVRGGSGVFPRLRDVGLGRALAVPIAGLASTPRRLGWRRTAWSFVSRYMPS
jgi:predicted metal-dependent phosphoesterase TrpH